MKEFLQISLLALDDKQAEDIKVFDISQISIFTDYFVIATGKNRIHTKSLIDEINEKMAKKGLFPRAIEGYRSGTWILLDYESVVFHIFTNEERMFYNIERIWADGNELKWSDLMA